MVDAIDVSACDEIASEVMREPENHLREQNKNIDMKIFEISMTVFSDGKEISNRNQKMSFKQLPTNWRGLKIDMLGSSIDRAKKDISGWIQKIQNPFDRIDFLVTLMVDSNEVFRENKTFDQLSLVVSKQAS